MIPYGRQSIGEADIDAVIDVLRSPLLTQGPVVSRFETMVANRVDAEFGVAVNSATSALHLACLALELGPGDVLWTTPNTFVASANAALFCGATVDFVDIDVRTYLLDVGKLEAKLEAAEQAGRLPKIVMPVHFAGQSCAMAKIGALAERYGFRVIEDASHAIGASYDGNPVGTCTHADIAIFSFHPVKIITTGEGGMAVTKNKKLADRMRLLRSHGITKDPALMVDRAAGDWVYEQVSLGFNYRMTDIQAALGCSQLERLDVFLERRRAIAARYDKLLASLPVSRPHQEPSTLSSWHLYVIMLAKGVDRRQVFNAMHARGIGVQVLYIPVHTQPFYQRMGFKHGDFPVAENYYARSFTLPIFADLSAEEQIRVVETLRICLEESDGVVSH